MINTLFFLCNKTNAHCIIYIEGIMAYKSNQGDSK